MKTPTSLHREKKDRKWSWTEIKQCLDDCYHYDGHSDGWNVQVIYRSVLVDKLRRRLYKKLT